MPLNIQGSGLHLDRNIAMVDDGQYLWVAGSISSMPPITTEIGSVLVYEVDPNDAARNNPANKFEYIISGTSSGVTGSEIGSIVQFIGPGSFVQVFTWLNDNIVTIGSWS